MLSFYFFIGCLSLSGRLRALGINHPKEKKQKTEFKRLFETIQRKSYFRPYVVAEGGLSGFFSDPDFVGRISMEDKYRHMGEIVYDNVVPFDRTQSFMTSL